MLFAKWCAWSVHHWVVGYMHKDGQLLPEFSCFPLPCWLAVAFCTHTLPSTMESIFLFKALAQNALWIWAYIHWISYSISVWFYYCILHFLESKYAVKTSHLSWSLSSSSQLLIMINPFYCSWDDSCTTLRQRQCTWTMCDPNTCWCNMEGDYSLLQRLEHIPRRFLSCLCFLRTPNPMKNNIKSRVLFSKPMIEG